MNHLGWLFTGANWSGPEGILVRLAEHLGYTALTMLVAMVIALPLGAWIGHTGRGGFVVVALANALRALPTLGLLVLLFLMIGLGLLGPLIALVIIAVPPLLAGAYAGVRNVDPAVVDAARGMGMRGPEVLWKVELPNALPLVIGGIRSATLQVISTATVAAYVGIGGLGRFILDGLGQRDFGAMIGGSILVAALAVVADLVLGGLQRLLVSPGLQLTAEHGRRPLRLIRGGGGEKVRAA
ncbi:ABC transporter permease [Pseudonocardia parietis]|uniref:Osmoprotectant transport system permease protein n=1 Tax=Pseudonocardia parietis TaxID=570936 RepID=A0ABS4VQ61_9PSEU|nr:ABC transporter permease [Pseudonocardia parietis]MBP2366064.1 osmoprotectant transport system permease protein [Pseudonocardia parietis]